MQVGQFARQLRQLIILAIGPPVFDCRAPAINEPKSLKSSQETSEMWFGILRRSAAEKSDQRCCTPLPARRNRPRSCTAKQCEKLATLHMLPSVEEHTLPHHRGALCITAKSSPNVRVGSKPA